MPSATLIIDRCYLMSNWSSRRQSITKAEILRFIGEIEAITGLTVKAKYLYCSMEQKKHADIDEWKIANVEVVSDSFDTSFYTCSKCNMDSVVIVNVETIVAIAMKIMKETFIPSTISSETIILVGGNKNYKQPIKIALENNKNVIVMSYESEFSSIDLLMIQGAQQISLNKVIAEMSKPAFQNKFIQESIQINENQNRSKSINYGKRKHHQMKSNGESSFEWVENKKRSRFK